MNSLSQYIDLYRENSAVVAAHCPNEAMNRARLQAFERLEAGMTLPDKRVDGYEKTDLNELFSPDLGVNISRMNLQADVAAAFKCAVPRMSTLMAVTIGDSFHGVEHLDERLPEGVAFMSLARAWDLYPEVIERYYGKVAEPEDASVALNTLLAQDGAFIYVAPGVKCRKPLQLVNLLNGDVALAAFRRLLVVVDRDAEVQLVECDHTQGNPQGVCLSSEVVEIALERNAKLSYCGLEEATAATRRRVQYFASQQEGSELNATVNTLVCGTTRNDLRIELKGEHTETFVGGMAIASGSMHIDNDTFVAHRVPHGRSNQLFKYVVDDQAQGAFEGSILVAPGAHHTEAFQTNRNILAHPDARMHTKPQLEIYNDDVKCSHGATTGQLDNKALFYMQTRGVPLEEGRRMLMQAFVEDVIRHIGVEELGDRLRHLVERRFSGDSMACENCRQI